MARGRGWRRGVVVASTTTWLGTFAAPGDAGGRAAGASPFRVRIARPALAETVEAALEGAARRLADTRCTALFTEFSDAAGRPLQAGLDDLGRSAPEYLALIGFYDGQGAAACLRGRTLAVTAPGSRAVWICPQFALEQRRDPGLAEATLVHEALHSLGLGEDPPSAAEITARVVARCGR